jgi:hypothetical protein
MTAVAEKSARPGGSPTARRAATRRAAARRAAKWLHLAAAPTFVLMALAAVLDTSPIAMTCMSGDPTWWSAGGMAPMYLLMAAFHLGPWLEVVSGER